jgi:hypothetical protein
MTGHRAGHLSPHVPIEMTGSVDGHDGVGLKSQGLRRLILERQYLGHTV